MWTYKFNSWKRRFYDDVMIELKGQCHEISLRFLYPIRHTGLNKPRVELYFFRSFWCHLNFFQWILGFFSIVNYCTCHSSMIYTSLLYIYIYTLFILGAVGCKNLEVENLVNLSLYISKLDIDVKIISYVLIM